MVDMIIDLEKIDDEFTVEKINGLTLVNQREIGIKTANQHFDDEEIWLSDLLYDIKAELDDIVFEALRECKEILAENNREIDVEK